MANSSAVSILDSNSSAKTVSTIDAMFSVAGTPSSVNVLTVQPSTAAFTVTVGTISSGTITSVSSATVFVSSGTIGVVGSLSSGTLASLSSGTVAISNAGVVAAVKGASSAPLASDPALVVAISPNGQNANGQALMANSAPVVLASNQTTISIAADIAQLANGASGTFLTPASTKATATSSGATTLVSSQASKKIRIISAWITANGAVNVNFQSHASTSITTGLTYFAAAGDGMVLPLNPLGWFTTASSEGLDIFLSAASSVDGYIQYVTV